MIFSFQKPWDFIKSLHQSICQKLYQKVLLIILNWKIIHSLNVNKTMKLPDIVYSINKFVNLNVPNSNFSQIHHCLWVVLFENKSQTFCLRKKVYNVNNFFCDLTSINWCLYSHVFKQNRFFWCKWDIT